MSSSNLVRLGGPAAVLGGALFVAVGSDAGILARGADALAAKFKS